MGAGTQWGSPFPLLCCQGAQNQGSVINFLACGGLGNRMSTVVTVTTWGGLRLTTRGYPAHKHVPYQLLWRTCRWLHADMPRVSGGCPLPHGAHATHAVRSALSVSHSRVRADVTYRTRNCPVVSRLNSWGSGHHRRLHHYLQPTVLFGYAAHTSHTSMRRMSKGPAFSALLALFSTRPMAAGIRCARASTAVSFGTVSGSTNTHTRHLLTETP